jgi:GMP synthase (glutamine-hydrolysing)
MEKILILDNGGQYVHRIWRTLRELGQGSEIVPREKIGEKLGEKPDGIILSGGPTSVYEDSSVAKGILELNVPILGICWGHQFIAHSLGGEVRYGEKGEYGHSVVFVDDEDTILKGMPQKFQAWVSHRDEVVKLPPGFRVLAHSEACRIEAMACESKRIYGVQFHPEVFHTQDGKIVLENFIEVCNG